jgi:hypothetical protein
MIPITSINCSATVYQSPASAPLLPLPRFIPRVPPNTRKTQMSFGFIVLAVSLRNSAFLRGRLSPLAGWREAAFPFGLRFQGVRNPGIR